MIQPMKILRMFLIASVFIAALSKVKAQPSGDPFSIVDAAPFDLGRPVEFRVSKVQDEKKRTELLRLFELFQAQYSSVVTDLIIPIEPFGPDPKFVYIEGTIHQHVGDNLYVFSRAFNQAFDPVMLQARPGTVWMEKQWVAVYAYHAGVSDWTDTRDAARRSPLFKVLDVTAFKPHPHSPTREAFLAALKAGARFPVVVPEKEPCKVCGGLGRYRPNHPDKVVECRVCAVTGKATVFKRYDLTW